METPRGPEHIPIMTYLIVLILAGWGGVSAYLARLRSTPTMSFTFAELIGEVIISGFAGLLCFFLAESMGVDQLLTIMLVGVSGHMGTRFLHLLEKKLGQKLFGDGDGDNGDTQ